MTLKEGRCPNCGSILNLDAAADKGHCLFCDAVFLNKDAFEIAENPAGVTFPNLAQPKYEGPSLDPQLSGQPGMRISQPQPKKKAKPAPPPVYVHKDPIKLPDIRLSRTVKLRILLISVVAILLIAGISVPLIMQRDAARRELLAAMDNIAPFSVDAGNAAAIWHTSNNYLMISAPAAVTEADLIRLFKAFCEKRASILDIDAGDFRKVYGRVTVKLVTPDGGFLIDKPSDQAELDSGSAIVKLP